MEYKRVYNDPVDENDIVNKRYVDKSLKTDIDYADIKNKPELFSGSYNDLSDKPTIPDVNNLGSIVVDDISCKNLFNINGPYTSELGSPTISGNSITVPSSADNSGYTKFSQKIEVNDSLTLSCTISDGSGYARPLLIPLDSSGNVISNLTIEGYTYNQFYSGYWKDCTDGKYSLTLNFPENVKYFQLGFVHNAATFTDIQIEKGSTATLYAPYKKFGYNSIDSMGKIVVDDIRSKNKFNKYGSLTDYIEYSSGTNTLENGKIKATANITNGNGKGQIIQLEPNTIYTYSVKVDSVEVSGSTSFRILAVNSDGSATNTILDASTIITAGETYSYQFTTGDTGKIWLTLNGITNNDYTIFKYVIYDNIQIEKGSTATNYSEYKGIGYTSGSNANGSWVKYDDGTLECRATKNSVGNTVITLPHPFVSTNYQLSFAPAYASSPNVMISWGDKTANDFKFFTVIDGIYTDTTNQAFDYTAIGRWK